MAFHYMTQFFSSLEHTVLGIKLYDFIFEIKIPVSSHLQINLAKLSSRKVY